MKKINLIIVLGMLISSNLFGQQDPHFSQFFSSPLTLNPASAGIFNGDFRAIVNYRSQWGAVSKAYSTSAASIDMPILKKLNGGMFGFGLNFFKDAAGHSKLSTTNFALSLAYHLDLSGGQKNHFISLGFQGGMIQRSISYDNLSWDSQWNGYGFDTQTQPLNVDDLGGTSAGGFDMSTGMHWYYAPSDATRFFAGASMFHVNTPDVGFNAESKLIQKYTFHGGGEIAAGEGGLAITPNFVTVFQGANKYTDIGAEFKYFIKQSSKFTNYSNVMYISAGPYLRWGDAAYIVARYGWSGMIVSVSYDFNVSDLSTASNGTGGYEVMLGYQLDLGSNATRGHTVKFQ